MKWVFTLMTSLLISTGIASAGTLLTDGEIPWDGKDRVYYYYEPDVLPGSPVPLVILLHGGRLKIDDFLGLTGDNAPFTVWFDIADHEKFICAVPQAWGQFEFKRRWNDCRSGCIECGDEDDVGFIGAMIDALSSAYPIDLERVYAAGVSNGGVMAYRLAREIPDRIAAIGAVIANEAAVSDCGEPVEPLSVLIMNGTEDPLFPWDGGDLGDRGAVLSATETAALWAEFNHCNSEPERYSYADSRFEDNSTVTREIWSGGDEGTEIVFYTIDGGGHLEPSITHQYPPATELIAGKQNHDIEMAYEIWAFLSRHTLSHPSSCSVTGVELRMPAELFKMETFFNLQARICNAETSALSNIPFFCLLDVYGAYWFFPSWSQAVDFRRMPIIPEGVTEITVIDAFYWPEFSGSASGIHFLAAMTSPEMDTILGSLGECTFDWEE